MTDEQPALSRVRGGATAIASLVAILVVAVIATVAIVLSGDDGDDGDGEPGPAASDGSSASDDDGEGATNEEGAEGDDPSGDEGEDPSDATGGDATDGGEGEQTAAPTDTQGALRDVAPDDLRIGVAAAGGGHHEEQAYSDPFSTDEAYRELLGREFDSLTPENQLKWEFVHPQPDEYHLGPAEEIVEFAEEHGQQVRGHTLLWHSQNPDWLENDASEMSEDELRALLREHIETVVGHFRGRIHQWDVANEIFDDGGQLRTDENLWLRELGPEIVADAFRWAHEADPDAVLFLNDYGADGLNAKSDAYHELAQELLADDVPIHGFGIQGHLSLQYSFPASVEDNLRRFDELGLETAITELDVRMPLADAGPTDEQLEQHADQHAQMLEACLNVPGCRSFTLWGATDRYSWVPHFFPAEGAATAWDEDLRPRPAYAELHGLLSEGRG